MPQMKRGMTNTIRAGKSGSSVSKMRQAPMRMFRPGNPKPVVDYHRAVCEMGDENARERKDRILG